MRRENHKVYRNEHNLAHLPLCKFYNLKEKQYSHKLKHHDNIARVESLIMSENFAHHDPAVEAKMGSTFGISFMTQKLPPAALGTAQAPNGGGIGGQRYRLSRRCRGISYLSLTCPTWHWPLRLFFNGSKRSRQLF